MINKRGRPKGIPASEEWKKNNGEMVSRRIKEGTWKTPFVKGCISPRKGAKLSKETKKKISESLEGKHHTNRKKVDMIGSKNPNFRGENARTKLYDRIRNSLQYSKWRLAVYTRDGFRCQNCNQLGSGNLNAHHIKAMSKIIKENNLKTFDDAMNCSELWDENNGVTLCKECHQQTESYLNKGARI